MKVFNKNKSVKNVGLYKKLLKNYEANSLTQGLPTPTPEELEQAYSDALTSILTSVATHSSYFSSIRKGVSDTSNNGISQLPTSLQATASNNSSIIVGLDFATPFIVKNDLVVVFNATQGARIKEAYHLKALHILMEAQNTPNRSSLNTLYNNKINDFLAA